MLQGRKTSKQLSDAYRAVHKVCFTKIDFLAPPPGVPYLRHTSSTPGLWHNYENKKKKNTENHTSLKNLKIAKLRAFTWFLK